MSERTLIAGTEAALPTTAGAATSLSEARVVRLYNSGGTARLVTVKDTRAAATNVGTFTILGNSVEFLQKNPTQVIFAADASVKGAAVGFAG